MAIRLLSLVLRVTLQALESSLSTKANQLSIGCKEGKED
jgi:hypothetical protein